MADYYNTTNAPIAVALQGGSSMTCAPKKWTYIPPAEEGHPSLFAALRKGHLVRAAVPITVEVVPVPPVEAAPPAVKAPVKEVVKEATKEQPQLEEASETTGSMVTRRRSQK